jgi:hypothetical protein
MDKWKSIKNYEKFFSDLNVIGECYDKEGILKEIIPKLALDRMAEMLLNWGDNIEYKNRLENEHEYITRTGEEYKIKGWDFEFKVDKEYVYFQVNSKGVHFVAHWTYIHDILK